MDGFPNFVKMIELMDELSEGLVHSACKSALGASAVHRRVAEGGEDTVTLDPHALQHHLTSNIPEARNYVDKCRHMLGQCRNPVLVLKAKCDQLVRQIHGAVVGNSRELGQRLQLGLVVGWHHRAPQFKYITHCIKQSD